MTRSFVSTVYSLFTSIYNLQSYCHFMGLFVNNFFIHKKIAIDHQGSSWPYIKKLDGVKVACSRSSMSSLEKLKSSKQQILMCIELPLEISMLFLKMEDGRTKVTTDVSNQQK
jgi:hypothetical protein